MENPNDVYWKYYWQPKNNPIMPSDGTTAPVGDTDDLIEHLLDCCNAGLRIEIVEEIWRKGCTIISQRIRQLGLHGKHNNGMLFFQNGDWNIYVGPPPVGKEAPFTELKDPSQKDIARKVAPPGSVEYGYAIGFNDKTECLYKGFYPRSTPEGKNQEDILKEFLGSGSILYE